MVNTQSNTTWNERIDENVVGLKIKLVIIIQGHKKSVPDCYFLITREIN